MPRRGTPYSYGGFYFRVLRVLHTVGGVERRRTIIRICYITNKSILNKKKNINEIRYKERRVWIGVIMLIFHIFLPILTSTLCFNNYGFAFFFFSLCCVCFFLQLKILFPVLSLNLLDITFLSGFIMESFSFSFNWDR